MKIIFIFLSHFAMDSIFIQMRSCSPFNSQPRGYKTFFMLVSLEHEILNARKYINIQKFGFYRLR